MNAFKTDISGTIEKGIKLGSKLGVPTLNLSIKSKKNNIEKGVYLCKTKVGDKIYFSLMHYGPKSIGTDDESKIFCEIHLLYFEEKVYDSDVAVQVLKKIRNVRQFESEESLKKQIQEDIEIANNYFKNA
jgi:riboflavin kinase/FMN adenylyltransferase